MPYKIWMLHCYVAVWLLVGFYYISISSDNQILCTETLGSKKCFDPSFLMCIGVNYKEVPLYLFLSHAPQEVWPIIRTYWRKKDQNFVLSSLKEYKLTRSSIALKIFVPWSMTHYNVWNETNQISTVPL